MIQIPAFDPGAMTGWSFWGESGLGWSGQAPLEQAMGIVVPYLKIHQPPLVIIESVFVGKGPAASLSVAEAAGEIKGFIRCAGLRPEIVRVASASWRSELNFPFKREGRRSVREDFEADARAFAQVHASRAFSKDRTHEAEAICMSAVGWELWVERSAA